MPLLINIHLQYTIYSSEHTDMAAKKGSMYVYKLENPKAAEPKKAIFGGWPGLRRSKTCRETQGGRPDYSKAAAERDGGVNATVEAAAARKSFSSSVESRKSVCNIEVNVGSAASLLQVKVMASDMPGFMQLHAFRCARTTFDSLEKFSSKHLAYNIKKEFDKVYGPAWHCIVGSSFGSFVTHSTGCFLYFSMEKLYILVFKTKIQKALHN
ncbi:uncharacterized protein LOC115998594 isoform X2 [Ipomoea triloba]|uniref:uncharacterized protein LOC115998594 isoform X2 n=1 Tax=Ipomoea triloba TaxID=35885 RepID=UPI00125D2018|nr:uncharacterized protein LOC115998594 isoform X2 [Ipomoea triloba]